MIEKHSNDQIKMFLSPEEKSIVDLISSAIIKKVFGEKEKQLKCNGHRAARSVNGKINNQNDLNTGLPSDIFTIEKLIIK